MTSKSDEECRARADTICAQIFDAALASGERPEPWTCAQCGGFGEGQLVADGGGERRFHLKLCGPVSVGERPEVKS